MATKSTTTAMTSKTLAKSKNKKRRMTLATKVRTMKMMRIS